MRQLLLLVSLIATMPIDAQEVPPVPTDMPTDPMTVSPSPSSSPSSDGTLVVEVVASDGSALPGVTVTVTSSMGTVTEITGVDGRARFPHLPAGPYQVASLYAGLYRATQGTLAAAGGEARIEMPIVGPVPRVPPSPPTQRQTKPETKPEIQPETQPVAAPTIASPSTARESPFEEQERTFRRLSSLEGWLVKHAASGLQLSNVISKGRGKSLFRFTRIVNATTPDFEISTRQPDPGRIEAARSKHVAMRFCGFHRLGSRSYVLMFCPQ